MKKSIYAIGMLLLSLVILSGCGGGEKKDELRAMDPQLDSLITNMAACKEQNTNCEAYIKAEEGIKAMAADSSKKFLVEDLFNGIAQSTSGARSAACAHALNFWVGSSDFYKNPAYGRIVLDALLKEKYDEASYNGSTLGQFLSGWLVTENDTLLKDIHAAIKDPNTEKRGRKELIRLSGKESFAKEGLLDILMGIAKDTREAEDVRTQALGVLWRVEDPAQVQKVEDLYLGFLADASPAIVSASLDGLGYMRSVKAYPKVLETIEKLGANQDYSSSAGRALSGYIGREPKEGIDGKKAFDLAVKLANNTALKPFYRSSYIYAIEAYGGKDAIAALTKLSAAKDKEMADPAKQALERVKAKK